MSAGIENETASGTHPVILAGYLRENDFAKELKCHVRTVWRMRQRGLPFVRMPTGIYIPIEEGREWIAARIVRAGRRTRKAA